MDCLIVAGPSLVVAAGNELLRSFAYNVLSYSRRALFRGRVFSDCGIDRRIQYLAAARLRRKGMSTARRPRKGDVSSQFLRVRFDWGVRSLGQAIPTKTPEAIETKSAFWVGKRPRSAVHGWEEIMRK